MAVAEAVRQAEAGRVCRLQAEKSFQMVDTVSNLKALTKLLGQQRSSRKSGPKTKTIKKHGNKAQADCKDVVFATCNKDRIEYRLVRISSICACLAHQILGSQTDAALNAITARNKSCHASYSPVTLLQRVRVDCGRGNIDAEKAGTVLPIT